jgi:hypothetical protein
MPGHLTELIEGRRCHGFVVQLGKRDADEALSLLKMKSIQRLEFAAVDMVDQSAKHSPRNLGAVIYGEVLGSDNFAVTPEFRKALQVGRKSDGRVPYPCVAIDMGPSVKALGVFYPFSALASEQLKSFDKEIKGKQIKYIAPDLTAFMEKIAEKKQLDSTYRIRELAIMILGTNVRARKLNIKGDSLASTDLFWRLLKSLDAGSAKQHDWLADSISASLAYERTPSFTWNKLGFASIYVGKSAEFLVRLSAYVQQLDAMDLLKATTLSPIPIVDQDHGE